MSTPVFTAESAESDLRDIAGFIAGSDGADQALTVLNLLEGRIRSLAELPGRGKVVPEMCDLHIADYREVQEPPWRIIYRVGEHGVLVLAVLDSRRDVRDILQARLLRP